jgi:hypothetical protein
MHALQTLERPVTYPGFGNQEQIAPYFLQPGRRNHGRPLGNVWVAGVG